MNRYKPEHFKNWESFLRYRKNHNNAQKKWIQRVESKNAEKRERRILRQRLYGRYYSSPFADKMSFKQYLLDVYGIKDIASVQIEELRSISAYLNA